MKWLANIEKEEKTKKLAEKFAQCLPQPFVVFLTGPLGAGKTTFVRYCLQALGCKTAVKSPTYTLVEPYLELTVPVYHFDLYRLAHPEELEYIGARDYFGEDVCCIIEWPEKASGYLPKSDLDIKLDFEKNIRQFICESKTQKGDEVLTQLKQFFV